MFSEKRKKYILRRLGCFEPGGVWFRVSWFRVLGFGVLWVRVYTGSGFRVEELRGWIKYIEAEILALPEA